MLACFECSCLTAYFSLMAILVLFFRWGPNAGGNKSIYLIIKGIAVRFLNKIKKVKPQ